MSSRPQFAPQAVFNSTTGQSMAGNLTSLITVIQKLSQISYGVSWSGSSPVGTIQVLVSNDYATNGQGTVSNAGTWIPLYYNQGTGTPVVSSAITGNTGTLWIDIPQTGAFAIKLVYTKTSGTGTLSSTICAKVS